MSDPIPHNRNRLGYLIGYGFHPLVVFIPTLIVVLRELPFVVMARWITFISIMILVPAFSFMYVFRRQGKQIYQREHRHALYLIFWLVMLVTEIIAIIFDAPSRLIYSLVCLLIWAPTQFLINFYFTKISGHTAVIAGIITALWVMGELDTLILQSGAITIALLTAWARIVTGNHTLKQVILGALVSSGAALLAGLLMGW